MAEIILTDLTPYRSGEEWYYKHVGNAMEDSMPVPSVVRYSFTAPSVGARKVTLSITGSYLETGNPISLRFHISTSATSHIDADSTFEYTGNLDIQSDGVTMAGGGEFMLLPNKTYYLWIFPNDARFGLYGLGNAAAVLVTSGVAGGVRIGADKKLHLCAIGQKDGSKKLYLPCIYNAAAGKWKLQS